MYKISQFCTMLHIVCNFNGTYKMDIQNSFALRRAFLTRNLKLTLNKHNRFTSLSLLASTYIHSSTVLIVHQLYNYVYEVWIVDNAHMYLKLLILLYVEQVQLKLYKYIFWLKKSTPTYMIYGEFILYIFHVFPIVVLCIEKLGM